MTKRLWNQLAICPDNYDVPSAMPAARTKFITFPAILSQCNLSDVFFEDWRKWPQTAIEAKVLNYLPLWWSWQRHVFQYMEILCR